MTPRLLVCLWVLGFFPGMSVQGEINVTVARKDIDDAGPGFRFDGVAPPSVNDAATGASFMMVAGQADRNSAGLEALHDGRAPVELDQPSENFFFNLGSDGGRLAIDLGTAIDIREVNTYSLHPGSRGPQVYRLFAADGRADDFNARPGGNTDPSSCGWKLLASVDTRPKDDEPGGQYGVRISSSTELLGTFRYLLFEISRTEDTDPFGNTFFSEMDVVDAATPPVSIAAANTPQPEPIRRAIETDDGRYHLTIDTTAAPDLTDWADRVLAPVVKTWYPKIVGLLPGDGFMPPTRVRIVFRPGMNVPAYANDARISCSADWFRKNLAGEAAGSVVHEMVHVVQQYDRARRNNRDAERVPGWLVEGIPDYIRWFLYEPQSKGAEITAGNLDRARYDRSYRVTANFLNWVTENHASAIVQKINAAAREGRYLETLWKDLTGKTVQELGDEWKRTMERRISAEATAGAGGGHQPAADLNDQPSP